MQTIRDNAGQIETATIGNRYALYGQANGTIVMTDDLGLAVLGAIQNGHDEIRMARAIVDHTPGGMTPSQVEATEIGRAIIEQWSQAGLFDAHPRAFPRPAGPQGEVTKWQLDYASDYGSFRVHTDDAHLAKELDIILAPFLGAPPKTSVQDIFHCTTNGNDEQEVFHDGAPIWSRTDRDEARFLLLKEAAQSLSGHSRVGAVLHGAAVRAQNGGVLIFIGESGSGKSTLSLGLVSKGWRLLADDHIPLSKDGTSLIAFPTATAVKPGSMDLEETQGLREIYGMTKSEREGVSYLRLPQAVDGGTELPITALVLPKFGTNLDFKLDRVTPEDAFSASVVSGARPCRRNPEIRALTHLCNHVPSYRLDFQTTVDSLRACQNIVDG